MARLRRADETYRFRSSSSRGSQTADRRGRPGIQRSTRSRRRPKLSGSYDASGQYDTTVLESSDIQSDEIDERTTILAIIDERRLTFSTELNVSLHMMSGFGVGVDSSFPLRDVASRRLQEATISTNCDKNQSGVFE